MGSVKSNVDITLYKKITDSSLPKLKEPESELARSWSKSLENDQVVKEYGFVSKLDFNAEKNELLVSSLSRISMYNISNMELKRSYKSRTEYSVYWASFRSSDHRLFTSSAEDGKIHVFESSNTKPLRIIGADGMTRHIGAVRVSEFFNDYRIISFSDDKHIKLWDLGDGSLVQDIGFDETEKKTAHDDYIRAGCLLPIGPTLVASGSYDHTVKIWDTRESGNKPAHQFKLSDPVECLIARDTFLISCGGRNLKVYDMMAGKVLKTLTDIHSKTITSLCVYQDNVVTASLDGHCKVYDSLFKLVTNLNYAPSQLLSLAICEKSVAVGTNDGLVIGRKFRSSNHEEKIKKMMVDITTFRHQRYFNLKSDIDEILGRQTSRKASKLGFEQEPGEIVPARAKHKQNLASFEVKMRKFQFALALDEAMKRAHPQLVVSLFQEMLRRGVLINAIEARSGNNLINIFRFVTSEIQNPRFNRVLVDVAIVLIDVYTPAILNGEQPFLERCVRSLKQKVDEEIEIMRRMFTVAGQINLLLSNSPLLT